MTRQTRVFGFCLSAALLLALGDPYLPMQEPTGFLAVLAASLLALAGLSLLALRRERADACLLGLYLVALGLLARDNTLRPFGAERGSFLTFLPALWLILLNAAALGFAWSFEAEARERGRFPLVLFLVGIAAQAFWSAAHFGESSGIFDARHPSPEHRILFYAAPLTLALQGAALWRLFQGKRDGRRGAALWLLAAGLLFIISALFADSTETLAAYVASDALAYLVVVALAHGLERHRLFGLRIEIRRVVQYALAQQTLRLMTIASLVSCGYCAGIATGTRPAVTLLRETAPVLSVILLSVSALLLGVRAPLLRWFDQTYFREVYDAQNVLNSVGRALLGVTEPPEIARAALYGIQSTLHPESAYLLAEEGGRLVCLAQRHRGKKAPVPPPIDSELLNVAAVQSLTVRSAAPEIAARPALEALYCAGLRLLIPLREEERAVGLILLGEKASGLAYAPEDVEMLRALASQTSLALHLARLNREMLLRNAQETLQRSVGFVELAEQERRLLAADLHDQTLPELRSLLADLETFAASQQTEPPEASHAAYLLNEMSAHLRRTMDEIRDIMESLRPSALEMLGLLPALENELRKSTARARPKVTPQFHVLDDALPELTAFAEVSIFRIMQEAVNNACRHAQASHIRVQIGADAGGWFLRVEDDGVGLPPEETRRKGCGLDNMLYRANLIGAGLTWSATQTGAGTQVELRLP